MLRGVLTGLNEAFIIDTPTRNNLVHDDPSCEKLVRPLVNGEDIRRWYVEDEGRQLILLPDGWTADTFEKGLPEQAAWHLLAAKHQSIARHLAQFADSGRKRTDKGAYWWELRPCSYYADFDGPKVFWPEMAKQPRFALAGPGIVGNKTTFMVPKCPPELLGLLMSRVTWFAISKLCVPIGERKGMLRYTLSAQFMERLPVPQMSSDEREVLANTAVEASSQAQARYKLHQRTRHRIVHDLGTPGMALNQKLTAQWGLDFTGFRAELQKVFRKDIPLKDRDEWEEWFTGQVAEHKRLTTEIVRLETDLNNLVYDLFALTPEERQIIEECTKYKYGCIQIQLLRDAIPLA